MKTSEIKRYGAVPSSGGYAVALISPMGKCRPLGNVRLFSTFETADLCAQEIASGQFDQWYAGEYVNMR